ncbi:MAG TPA: SRPBCC family protein [Actinospica sp.]|nr:SRPBCC family protein [Actinospica sp.]
MSRGRVAVAVRVRAPAQAVWEAVTDWPAQGDWMPATHVRPVGGDGRGVGGRIEAFTGIGRLGFLDTMVVTEWRPPNWCAVRHTGRVVRGTGAFAVEEPAEDDGLAPGTVRLVWYEDLELPGGAVGALGWRLIRRFIGEGVGWSLGRLARSVER